jgi:Raf kinase inhibitor-like YbhB/YbcL family protein
MIAIIVYLALIMNSSITVTSSSFVENGLIPSKYTCEGSSINPPIHITNLPANTKTIAIIVQDPDAQMEGGFTHWVACNIDPVADIPESFKGGMEGMNGAKKLGYIGPCPPSGTHHYHFMVYALDTKLKFDKSPNKEELEKAMKGHILSQGDLVGLYKKFK